jgi:hypothetical protein
MAVTREYLVQLINSWNTGVDTSIGGDFDLKFISPLLEYLGLDPYENTTDITNFIQKRINAYDPSLSTVKGSANYDILIGPMSLLLEPVKRGVNQLKNSKDITKYASLTKEDMDMLASNFYIHRRLGFKAATMLRVYFLSPSNVNIFPTAVFSTPEGLNFYPTTTYQFSSDEVALNFENGYYYVEINVEAENYGPNYNVIANSIVSAKGVSNYARVTNPVSVLNGLEEESNEELYERILLSITERTPTTEKGIRTLLLENFPYIKHIDAIGASDPGMTRDNIPIYSESASVSGDPTLLTTIKTGNKVDVYIMASDYQLEKVDFVNITTTVPLLVDSSTYYINSPLIRVTDVELLDPVFLTSTGIYIPRKAPIDARALYNFSGGETGYAVGVVRLFFERPTSLQLTPETVFTDGNGYKYSPTLNFETDEDDFSGGAVISQSEMDTNTVVYGNITYYYCDVQVKSYNAGLSATNLEANSALTVAGYTSEGWSLSTTDSTYAMSTKENVSLVFTSTYNGGVTIEGASIRVVYETSKTIHDSQEFLENDEYRCITIDPLAKSYTPMYANVYIEYDGTIDETSAVKLIQDFLLNTEPGEYLDIYSFVKEFYKAGAYYIKMPLSILLIVHNPDRTITSVRVTDKYLIPKTGHVLLGSIMVQKVPLV